MPLLRALAVAVLPCGAATPVPGQSQSPGDQAAPAQAPVWTITKILVCEVMAAQNCRLAGCEPAARLPSFRVDLGKQTMCGIVGDACRNEIRVGQVGFDRASTRMTLHTLGAAFVVGIDADGTMNGADVVRGRVLTIQGRCVPG